MKNNWVLQASEEDIATARKDYDDYGYGEAHPVSIGDEIVVDDEEYFQNGIVIGIIRNVYGQPTCYKVVSRVGEDCTVEEIDYISPDKMTTCEPCGSAAWSLGRIGYKLIEDDDASYFKNEITGDVIYW